MQLEEVHSETFIPFDAYERDGATNIFDRLFATHVKCLGYAW